MERAGHEWRWKRHSSVTFNGNRWYRHSQKVGSYAIDFMQEFYGMSFPEAVCYLLNGEQGEAVHRNKNSNQSQNTSPKQKASHKARRKETSSLSAESNTPLVNLKEQNRSEESLPKILTVPEKNDNMKRIYAYLIQKRFISRDVISFFARQGTLYECKDHHNIIFAGADKEGNIRHIHKKGTYSDGGSFRINEEGSDPSYGFGYAGTGKKLYAFEAPIDFLSFITLFPESWQENSYIVLSGVGEHAIIQKLLDNPKLDTVILCLDHDAAGIEACGRIHEILTKKTGTENALIEKIKTPTVKMLQSEYKDWNEDLKARNGIEPIPAQEHPKITECASWIEVMKEVCHDVSLKYATKEYLLRYYKDIYDELKNGLTKDNIGTAFDGDALLLSGMAVKCVERFGKEMGKETDSIAILDHLKKCYQPHKDKGNVKTKLRNLQQSFEETMEVFNTKDLSQAENKELAAGFIMFAVIGGLSLLPHYYTLNGIKSRTVGDGQHGTARFAT